MGILFPPLPSSGGAGERRELVPNLDSDPVSGSATIGSGGDGAETGTHISQQQHQSLASVLSRRTLSCPTVKYFLA